VNSICPVKSEYHGIIIKESLKDQFILRTMKILGKKASGPWTFLRIGAEGGKIDEVLKLVKENLLTENSVPYYAHFYRDKELIVVFPEKIFYVKPDRESWGPVVSYEVSRGIPQDEMDMKPCRLEDETY
jgi:hypothetical protein